MEFQPYWLAYAQFRGLEPDSEYLKNMDFIPWILEREAEYGKSIGKNWKDLNVTEKVEFVPWLNKWVNDHKFESESSKGGGGK